MRELRITLPAEGELYRVVNAALSGFFYDIQHRITAALTPEIRARIDALLVVPEASGISTFETLKADARQPGIENLQAEIEKFRVIRTVGVGAEPFVGIPWKVRRMLKRRATNETATEMREHPDGIRYGLMGCFLSSAARR